MRIVFIGSKLLNKTATSYAAIRLLAKSLSIVITKKGVHGVCTPFYKIIIFAFLLCRTLFNFGTNTCNFMKSVMRLR
jgi:hypothetical protein